MMAVITAVAMLVAGCGGDKKEAAGGAKVLIILENIGSGRLHKINWQQMPDYLG